MGQGGEVEIDGGFEQGCEQVLDFLSKELPLDLWAVTRCDGHSQVWQFVRDHVYDIHTGDAKPWSESLCHLHETGRGPAVAADLASVPAYAQIASTSPVPVGAVASIPIRGPKGELFGTLCGLDRHPQPDRLPAAEPLLRLVASLLETILDRDTAGSHVARQLRRAEMLADTDELTGLANRRGWQHWIDHEEERFRRYGDPAAVVAVDLDDLKAINDRHGHAAGDHQLIMAADAIRRSVRASDLAARLGGDEFGVIATHSSAQDVAALADRLRMALAEAGVEASVGHAGYDITAGFIGTWAAADAAMYDEKRRRQQPRTG
jgi:diguanylate cyclase (GGDEF)-like protein